MATPPESADGHPFDDADETAFDVGGFAAYDPWRQMTAAVGEVLDRTVPGGSLFWGCEYECPAAFDGSEFYVDRSDRLDRGSCTLTFGAGDVSVELDFAVDPAWCDGQAVFAADIFPGMASGFDVSFPDLLWVGRAGDEDRAAFLDDCSGQLLYPAVSLGSIGAQLAATVALVRPDVSVQFDPDWRAHRHPLEHLLNRTERARELDATPTDGEEGDRGGDGNGEEDVYTLSVKDDGSPKVQVTGQVMDVLITLEMAYQEFLDGMEPADRDRYLYEEAWMDWTDGTFDPSGFVD